MERKKIYWRVGFISLVLLLCGLSFWGGKALAEKETKRTPIPLAVNPAAAAMEQAFIQVADAVRPAVVSIMTTQKIVQRSPFDEFFNDPFFRRFFGGDIFPEQPRQYMRQSLGSGVIVSPDGYVLTNNHVIQNATEVKVKLLDNREFTAKVIGQDEKSDLALLKINETNLPSAVFGDSSQIRIGQWVMAVGNPFGLEATVTVGVISATGRHLGINPIESFIQTDASINPGNSGGPLVNLAGQVIGINTAIVGGGQGIGFAIPSNMAQDVFEQIRTSGRVVRGWLGVEIQPLEPEMAKVLGLKGTSGVLIANVRAETPAEKANLKAGDVILKVDNQPVATPDELQQKISSCKPGQTVLLTIWRDNKEQTVRVKLAEQPETLAVGEEKPTTAEGEVWRGIKVSAVTEEIARQAGLPTPGGVLVTEVTADSPATGKLPPGAIILEINRQPVTNLSEFLRLTRAIPANQPVLLRFYAQRRYLYLVLPGE